MQPKEVSHSQIILTPLLDGVVPLLDGPAPLLEVPAPLLDCLGKVPASFVGGPSSRGPAPLLDGLWLACMHAALRPF